MHRVTRDQQASGFRQNLPAIGTAAPLFSLANQDGKFVSSGALLAQGPLVVSFFRGQW
jgi:peroxiredoxin